MLDFSDDMSRVNIDFNNVTLNNAEFDDDDLETVINVRQATWYNRYIRRNAIKK